MEKITNKLALEYVLGLDVVKENVEVFEKLSKMHEQVCKKNTSSDKLTKTQEENLAVKDRILQIMTSDDRMLQIKDLVAKLDNEFTNQKLSALIRQLVEEGKVEKIVEKRVSYFKVVK